MRVPSRITEYYYYYDYMERILVRLDLLPFLWVSCGSRIDKHFPRIVTYASKTEPAYSFDHYVVALDAEYPNKATRVKAEFWVSLPRTTLLNTSHSLDFS